jgi:hypothetical protein
MKKKPDNSKKAKAPKPEKKPKSKDSAELSDDDLTKVAGGMAGWNRGIGPSAK